MTAFTIGLTAALMWVGVITTSVIFVRNSPDPPMKSIKRFRLSRQALKQSKRSRPAGGEDLDFPLGPRIFRKSEPEPSPRTYSLEEGSDQAPLGKDADQDAPATLEGQGLRIVPKSELEKDAGNRPSGERAGKDVRRESRSTAKRLRSEQEVKAGKGRAEARKETAALAAAESESQTGWVDETEREADPESGPVVVRPVDVDMDAIRPEERPAKQPEAASGRKNASSPPPQVAPQQHEDEDTIGGQPKKARDKGQAEKLSRYAMKVGPHSYVLVDEDGHLVKQGTGRKHG